MLYKLVTLAILIIIIMIVRQQVNVYMIVFLTELE